MCPEWASCSFTFFSPGDARSHGSTSPVNHPRTQHFSRSSFRLLTEGAESHERFWLNVRFMFSFLSGDRLGADPESRFLPLTARQRAARLRKIICLSKQLQDEQRSTWKRIGTDLCHGSFRSRLSETSWQTFLQDNMGMLLSRNGCEGNAATGCARTALFRVWSLRSLEPYTLFRCFVSQSSFQRRAANSQTSRRR